MSLIGNTDETAIWSGIVSDLNHFEIPAEGTGFPLDSMYNADSLLHEVCYVAKRLAHSGELTTTDMSSVTVRASTKPCLFEIPVEGKVGAPISVFESSRIREVAQRGAWLVKRYPSSGGVTVMYPETMRLLYQPNAS